MDFKYDNLARRYSFLRGDPDFYGTQAFNDGWLKFREDIKKKGFTEGPATVQTYFSSFFVFTLRAIITAYIRRNKHFPMSSQEPSEINRPVIEEEDLYSERQILLTKALALLDEKSRQHIILKGQNIKKEQIAEKMGISPVSVNNEYYRAKKKLQEIIKSLTGKY